MLFLTTLGLFTSVLLLVFSSVARYGLASQVGSVLCERGLAYSCHVVLLVANMPERYFQCAGPLWARCTCV